jgi:hypothetical protein
MSIDDDTLEHPGPDTTPSPETVAADRLPTSDEEETANLSEPYQEARHRGATIRGDSQIEPDG